MRLQEQIKKDLAAAMKAKDDDTKSTLRVIMGEFGRQGQKELGDEDVVRIVKKLIKAEKEVMEKTGVTEPTPFIRVAEKYLPQMATKDEIRAWITANVDFGEYKNKMQAMRPIMQHFGGNADGDLVKKVLTDF